MQVARMNAFIRAPIDRIWAFLIDYEGYARIPAVKDARLVAPGRDHRSGVGAVREVTVLGSTFEEEIVEFEPPNRLAYRITKCRPLPVLHDIGRVELETRGDGTEINWKTRFEVDVPIFSEAASKMVRLIMQHQ